MRKLASDDLRKEVWDALVKHEGDREKAALQIGKSLRTLNRHIHDLNLYPDLDKAGFIRNQGPPRGVARGTSLRETQIIRHIKKNHGEIDYGALAFDMYGEDNDKTRQRVYTALNELKGKGKIALDGIRWFVL